MNSRSPDDNLHPIIYSVLECSCMVFPSLMLPSSARIGFVLPKMGRSFLFCPIVKSFIESRELAKL
jgi:hypothetical protein